MFKKILLIPASDAVDQPVVRRALQLTASAAADTEIVVCDFVYQPMLEGYHSNKEVYEPLRRRLVEERLETARALGGALTAEGRKASALALWDHPLDLAVARQVVEQDVDCVLMQPSSGRGSALSHADWRVVAGSPVPVLLVKTTGTDAYRHILAAVDPMHAHAKPAELDDAILAHARDLQSRLGADLRALHCYTSLEELSAGIDAGIRLEEADRALEEVRRRELEDLVDKAGLPRSVVDVATGRPEAVIEARVEAGQADLVVMGVLSRGRLRDLLIGSTAERVLQRVRADVLTVKPPGMGFARRG